MALNTNYNLDEIILLHCVSSYPPRPTEMNMYNLPMLKQAFDVPVGFSDHSTGITSAIIAVTLGAKVIEKHFTLDRKLPGPDHKASLCPDDLRTMVKSIRFIEQALGDSNKKITTSEQENIAIARKSIVAKQNIATGEIFSEHNLTTKRPGTGLSPMLWDQLIGSIADKNYDRDDLISGDSLSKA